MGWRRAGWSAVAAAVVGCALVVWAQAPEPGSADAPDEDLDAYTLVNEQLILIATIVAAIAALPPLIEFVIDRRKRKERIDLSLDDVAVADLRPRLAGMDELLGDIADLIDRARNPDRYPHLTVGNEVLILGPNLSGKKTLAQRIAKEAKIERLITVYNPRYADALAKAKSLIHRYRRTKLMLLLPRIDSAFEKEDEDVLSELEALVETTSEKANVLVVGTAVSIMPDSPLDNAFGIKIVLPGTRQEVTTEHDRGEDVERMLRQVVGFYHEQSAKAGFRLDGLSVEELTQRVLRKVNNPAEIEDIFSVMQTAAIYRRHSGQSSDLLITPGVLDTAVSRVIVGAVPGDA